MNEYSIDKKINGFAPLGTASDWGKSLNGGKGSGNFGHAGRPGEVGGSAPGGGAGAYRAIAESNERVKEQEGYLDRIKHILGKKPKEESITSYPESSYIDFEDGGKRYSYEKRSDTLREISDDPMSRGKAVLSPEEKKAQADDWFTGERLKGQDIKKRLKSYGLNVDGLSISRDSGGYSDAWRITGSGSKHDLKTIEKIVKSKLESYDVDERTGEILAGGNTFVFVRDTDENSFAKALKNKITQLEKALNGGKGSGNFGHAGRIGERGGSAPTGTTRSSSKSEEDIYEWGKKNLSFPEDMRHGEKASFDQMLARMYDGKDFYKEFGDLDSADREIVFDEMAKRTGLDYSDIYHTWLQGHNVDLEPDNPNYDSAKQAEKNVRIYLQDLAKSPRQRDLDSRNKTLSRKERDEQSLRSMVASVWTYSKDKQSRYLTDDTIYTSLTPKQKKQIIDDEWGYLDKNVETESAWVGTEGEEYISRRFKRR